MPNRQVIDKPLGTTASAALLSSMLYLAVAVVGISAAAPLSAHELRSSNLHIHEDAVEDDIVVLGQRVRQGPQLLISDTIHSQQPSIDQAAAGIIMPDADSSSVDPVGTDRAGAMRASRPR
jgi:hypothetical protein